MISPCRRKLPCENGGVHGSGWTVEELQKLLKDHQEITVNLSTLLETDDTSSAARPIFPDTRASNAYVLMISSDQAICPLQVNQRGYYAYLRYLSSCSTEVPGHW